MRSIVLPTAALLLVGLAACSKTADEAVLWDTFGGEVTDGDFMTVAQVVGAKEEHDGKTVRVEGAVESVCKKKGCWMMMRAGDDEIRVKFKDYAFFVPLDCEGRNVQLVGDFAVETTSVEDIKHYLEDAGKPDEAAKVTAPRTEMTLVATGVRMEPVAAADGGAGE